MPAQAQHHVMSAYLSATSDDVDVGDVMIPDAAGEFYIKATLANRTAASRTTTAAGIALSPGDAQNRAIEIQTVGPCPQEVTLLGSGSATTIRVSDAGRLERGGSAPLAGNCDEDGFAYLNFTGSGGGGGGGAPTDASYVTLGTNGDLSAERVLTAGTGITVTDAGAGSTVTVAAPGLAAPFITQALSGDLANERALAAGTGITLTDGGAGSTMTVAAPGMAAQFVTIAATGDLANERVLTAGTGISLTDGGAGSTITVTNTLPGGATLVEADVSGATHHNLSTLDGSDKIRTFRFLDPGAVVTGLADGEVGDIVHLYFQDGGQVNNASGSSTDGNRFRLGAGANVELGESQMMTVALIDDGGNPKWVEIAQWGVDPQIVLARGQTFGGLTDLEAEHRGNPRHYQTSGTDVEHYQDEDQGFGKSQTQHKALVLADDGNGDLHKFTVPAGDGAINIQVTCTYAYEGKGDTVTAGLHTHVFQLKQVSGTITDVTDFETTPDGTLDPLGATLTWSTDITSSVVDIHILNESGFSVRFVGDALLQFVSVPP